MSNSKRYVTVVSPTVTVPVSGNIKDAEGKSVAFKFTLTCSRITATEMKDRVAKCGGDLREVLKSVVTGWKGQRLVLVEGSTEPAEFCEEALDALLDIGGMVVVCLAAYNKEYLATEKN